MISILNTVEYNEYKHGTRDEAIIASLRPFLTKLGSALIVVITSVSYMLFGVTEYTNQISSLENQASAGTITEEAKLAAIDSVTASVGSGAKTGLLITMVCLSAVLFLVSYFLYRKFYKIDEAEYDRICKVLAEKKNG